MDKLIQWLTENQMPCFFKKYIDIRCPGCGLQTALIELLKGNIFESIIIYPALIPMLFLIFFLLLHLIFKFKKGALILKITFILSSILIVSNYIIKLIIN